MRALPYAAISATVASVALIGLLHVIPPSSGLSPVRRTISHYALLETGWVFTLGVLALAAGALAALAALVRARLLRSASWGAAALALFAAGLIAVAYFPKHDWSVGPSMSGHIHRAASVAAFLSLPVAALAVGWAWRRHERWRPHSYASLVLGVLSLLAFSPIVAAVAAEPYTGVPWWVAVPLGAVERVLALCQVLTVLCLAGWARTALSSAGTPAVPPSE